MFLAKKVLAALLLPPASLLFLALLGLWLTVRRSRTRTAGIVLLSLSISALLALSLPVVGRGLLASLETAPPITPAQLAQVQAIVVLGGGLYRVAPEYGGDTVNAFSLERVRYAAHLARGRKLPLLVTGGAPTGGLPEAQAMREVLSREFGVAVRWTESASLDTADNARYAAEILRQDGIRRIALVSHGFHLPRAVPLFEREGLQVTPAPTVFSLPPAEPLFDWLPSDFRPARLAAHEYLGRGVDRLRHALE